jgi:hypothetical protein
MRNFKKGDWVRCVDARESLLIEGNVYVVEYPVLPSKIPGVAIKHDWGMVSIYKSCRFVSVLSMPQKDRDEITDFAIKRSNEILKGEG